MICYQCRQQYRECARCGRATCHQSHGPACPGVAAERERVRGKLHGDPDHSCSWACPGASPMTDIRALSADLGAGMTEAELHAKHWRPGPFSFGPDPADIDILMEAVS